MMMPILIGITGLAIAISVYRNKDAGLSSIEAVDAMAVQAGDRIKIYFSWNRALDAASQRSLIDSFSESIATFGKAQFETVGPYGAVAVVTYTKPSVARTGTATIKTGGELIQFSITKIIKL